MGERQKGVRMMHEVNGKTRGMMIHVLDAEVKDEGGRHM